MNRKIKLILAFALISIGIDLIKKLIYNQFDLSKLLDWNFLIFELAVEFGLLFITAFLTLVLTKKIVGSSLGHSLLKVLVFGILYGLVCLISTRLMLLSMGAEFGFQFDIHHSFLKFIPNGFTQGLLFMLVFHHLYSRNGEA